MLSKWNSGIGRTRENFMYLVFILSLIPHNKYIFLIIYMYVNKGTTTIFVTNLI